MRLSLLLLFVFLCNSPCCPGTLIGQYVDQPSKFPESQRLCREGKNIFLFYVYGYLPSVFLHNTVVCLVQLEVSYPPGLELQMIVSHHGGAGNRTLGSSGGAASTL